MKQERLPRSPRAGKRPGQTVIEYVMVGAVVVAILLTMQVFLQRRVQAVLKLAADDLSPYKNVAGGDPDGKQAQLAGLRYETGERRDKKFHYEVGTVLERQSAVRTTTDANINLRETPGGRTERNVFSDHTNTAGAVTGRGAEVSAYSSVVVSEK